MSGGGHLVPDVAYRAVPTGPPAWLKWFGARGPDPQDRLALIVLLREQSSASGRFRENTISGEEVVEYPDSKWRISYREKVARDKFLRVLLEYSRRRKADFVRTHSVIAESLNVD